jgi:hypothetical protein
MLAWPQIDAWMGKVLCPLIAASSCVATLEFCSGCSVLSLFLLNPNFEALISPKSVTDSQNRSKEKL